MDKNCTLRLCDGDNISELTLKPHELHKLPIQEKNERGSFIGWSRFEKLKYGFTSTVPGGDASLYAIRTNEPAYILRSHFRGDPEDSVGKRAHYRRYVIDVYLENSDALDGELKLELPSPILWYIGNIPIDGVKLNVTATGDSRGGAYCEEAYMSTSSLSLAWTSERPMRGERIARLMLTLSTWGMSYGEIARRSSDDMLTPAIRYKHRAGDAYAYVSANFYDGTVPEEELETIDGDKNVEQSTEPLPEKDMGELLCRYALLSDSHVGVRYEWENYDWLHGVYDNLAKIHADTPFDFVAELGDNIDDGYAKTYERDYEIYLEDIKNLTICDAENPIENRREGTIPHYEIQGNHDTSLDTRFFRTKLWYIENSSGKKTAHIAFFTNYGGYPAVAFTTAGYYDTYRSYGILSDESVKFVEESIIAANEAGAKQIVLYNHFGIARDLSAPILPETGLGKIELLCKKYGIRLYFNGHEHNKPYTLRKYGELYDFDAAMTKNAYATVELYEKGALVTIFDTDSNTPVRFDRITL